MISDMKHGARKALRSSTFWTALLLPALKLGTMAATGIDIPWEVVLAGVGVFGVKEGAKNFGATAATTKANAGSDTP